MKIDREKALRSFHDYTAAYDSTDDKVKLKIEHTLRVSDLCEQIAGQIGLSQEERSLAWLIGLLHDVGRFEQLRLFGTFQDAESVDHAAYGADILFREGHIRDYVDEEKEDALLERAIRLHNVYRLPEGMDERSKRFSSIIRDADKIDILRANVDFPLDKIYNVSEAELKQVLVSPEIMQNFLQGRTSKRQDKHTVADHVVNQAAFAFELAYPVSLQIMVSQGYLERLLQFESDNPVTQEQFGKIRAYMRSFLQGKEIHTDTSAL